MVDEPLARNHHKERDPRGRSFRDRGRLDQQPYRHLESVIHAVSLLQIVVSSSR